MNDTDDLMMAQSGGVASQSQIPSSNPEDLSNYPPSRQAPTIKTFQQKKPSLVESQFAVEEVVGDAPVNVTGASETGIEAGAHEEVASPEGSESAEELVEATSEQLATKSGEENALSDLRGIEGFEAPEASEESGVVETQLREVGTEIEGSQEEFFPILAALAPTLISTIGPAIAKGVISKLSPRAKNLIKRLPKSAPKVIGTANKAATRHSSFLTLVAKLLETAEQMPGGESGEEFNEAFVEEAAAALEVIIGIDDRVPIKTTTQVPWRRLCALRIYFPSGAVYRGTGFLIGPRSVATAGHCVYLHNQGGWARKIEVIPACNGSSNPYGRVESNSFRSVGGWINSKKPESDYGCIVLPFGAFGGRNLGSFGFASFPTSVLLAQPAVLAGYPGDKPFAELWGMARKIKTVSSKTLIYDIDTVGGQSGAPVYIKHKGQRYVVGIHNYGAASGNSATRITEDVYKRLLGWSKL